MPVRVMCSHPSGERCERFSSGMFRPGSLAPPPPPEDVRNRKPAGAASELERVEALEEPESSGPMPNPASYPDVGITGAGDPEQFRRLVALARRWIAEYRRERLLRISTECVEKLPPEDAAVLEAIEAFEDKHGPGSFKWNQAGAKELFYSAPGGHWPLPEQLRRIREHVEASTGMAAE